MMEGRVRSAVQLLIDRAGGCVLNPRSEAQEKNDRLSIVLRIVLGLRPSFPPWCFSVRWCLTHILLGTDVVNNRLWKSTSGTGVLPTPSQIWVLMLSSLLLLLNTFLMRVRYFLILLACCRAIKYSPKLWTTTHPFFTLLFTTLRLRDN